MSRCRLLARNRECVRILVALSAGLKPAETGGTGGIALEGELAEDGRQRLCADGIGWHDDTRKRADRVAAWNGGGDVLVGFYSRAKGGFGALAFELSHGELFAKAFDALAELVDVGARF